MVIEVVQKSSFIPTATKSPARFQIDHAMKMAIPYDDDRITQNYASCLDCSSLYIANNLKSVNLLPYLEDGFEDWILHVLARGALELLVA